MGAAFDKWLAKPGTLHFLRRLVTADRAHSITTATRTIVPRHVRRYHAVVIQDAWTVNGGYSEPKYLPQPPRGHPDKFDAPELGLQMSLNSGVAILDKDGDHSQAFSELRFQSDVSASSDTGKRLVDSEEHRNNAKLWIEILRFRQRIDGLPGVSDVWKGMRRRQIDLPVEGTEADLLWRTFIDASVGARDMSREASLLSQILNYARDLRERTGLQYRGLYKRIVGHCFRLHLDNVKHCHKRLKAAHLITPQDLASVVMDAICASSRRDAFHIWKNLGLAEGRRDIYDTAISELLDRGDLKLALLWHRRLLGVGQGPGTPMFKTPGVQKLFEMDGDRSLPMVRSSQQRQEDAELQPKVEKPEFPQLTRASMNEIVGNAHGIKPKTISDSFCARLFATRAFSLDLVIKGLSFLSIESLGPLTIREMAIRSGSPLELNEKLSDLEKLGIKVGNSVFAKLVAKATRDGDDRLWTAVLESDQHPDVFEDPATQEALLISFLKQGKFGQAHLSLEALSLTTPNSHLRSWNRVFQHHIANRDYTSLVSTMRSMQSQGLPLTLYSLVLLYRYLLPTRRRGKRPIFEDRTKLDKLQFVRNVCAFTASKGHYVPMNLWVEVLKRYGMTRGWIGTERLVVWLFDHYTEARPAFPRNRRPRPYMGENRVPEQVLTLRRIFQPNMLRALFIWGFRDAKNVKKHKEANSNEPPCEPWAEGLALLRRIQKRRLFDVKSEARTAFQQLMWVLFGAGFSTLGINNLARMRNRISLAHYINHANEVWEGIIDWVDPALLRESSTSDPKLLTQFFGSMYRTNLRTAEYANVTTWAAALGQMKHSHYAQPVRTRAKESAWRNSMFRFLLPTVGTNRADANPSTTAGDTYKPFLAPGEAHHADSSPPPEHQSHDSDLDSYIEDTYRPVSGPNEWLHANSSPPPEHKSQDANPAIYVDDTYTPFSALEELPYPHSNLPREHQLPSARSWSSRPRPSPRYIPAPR